MRRLTVVIAVLVVGAGCGRVPPGPAASASPSAPTTPNQTSDPSPSPSSESSRSGPAETATPPPSTTKPATPKPSTPQPKPKPPTLRGDARNGFAFAPLDDPGEVTVEGGVTTGPAWSTSKVLIIAAFLDTVADGRPDRVSAANRRLITLSLTRSDGTAVNRLRDQIPGRSGAAMTAVLRDIGDRTTVAPDSYQGLMRWSLREQVRFMGALARGRVVSKAASAYLLDGMQPVASQAWGLARLDAEAVKGGWLRSNTVTRQMGVVDGYAVAIITSGVGPAVVQSDGDSAHVRQMNKLARLLQKRLDYEQDR